MNVCKLERNSAEAAIRSVLVGANLDQIAVHSVQLSLRFLSDRVRLGELKAIDVTLSCEASCSGPAIAAGEGFFARRARFLPSAYALIGNSIDELHLSNDGTLKIEIGKSSVWIFLAEDDRSEEDSPWMIEVRASSDQHGDVERRVCCVPCDGEVEYYQHDKAG